MTVHPLNRYIEHAGVKGMKWGVRKKRNGKIAPRATLARADRKDSTWVYKSDPTTILKQGQTYSKVYKKAAPKIRRGTRQLNKDPRFKDADFRKDSPLRQEYYKAYSKMVTDQLNAAVYSRGLTGQMKGVSPHKRFALVFNYDMEKQISPDATIRRVDTRKGRAAERKNSRQVRKLTHAADVDDFEIDDSVVGATLEVKLVIDDMGFITDSEVVEPVTHGFQEEFEHYGVPGMKWGVRKRPSATTSTSTGGTKPSTPEPSKKLGRKERKAAEKAEVAKKTRPMTDAELKSAIQRLQLEKQFKELKRQETFVGQLGERGKKAVLDAAETSLKNGLADPTTALIKREFGDLIGVSKMRVEEETSRRKAREKDKDAELKRDLKRQEAEKNLDLKVSIKEARAERREREASLNRITKNARKRR